MRALHRAAVGVCAALSLALAGDVHAGGPPPFANHDFRLQSTSPLIDAGTFLTRSTATR